MSKNLKGIWTTEDRRVTVGFKQPDELPPHPVCYCFGYTRENNAYEVIESGDSTVIEWITERVQPNECAYEFKNPTGRCCLRDVREVVQKASQ